MQDIVVVFGPAGSGKNSLISDVLDELPGYVLARSATTRPFRRSDDPTGGGVNSKYDYVTPEEFAQLIADGKLLEHNLAYAGCSYGTLRPTSNQNAILEINIDGARQVRALNPTARLVFVTVPGDDWVDQIDLLSRRLTQRNRQNNAPTNVADFSKRLGHATVELEEGPSLADLVIVNDDRAAAAQHLLNFIRSR